MNEPIYSALNGKVPPSTCDGSPFCKRYWEHFTYSAREECISGYMTFGNSTEAQAIAICDQYVCYGWGGEPDGTPCNPA